MNLRLYALVTSLAALGLGALLWREHTAAVDLAAQNTRQARQLAELRYETKQAAQKAAELSRHAVELDSQLGSAKANRTATEVRQFQLTRELSETKSRLTEREQREVALMAERETLRQKIAEAAAAAEAPVMLAPLMVVPGRPKPRPAPAVAAEAAPAAVAAVAAPAPPPEPAVDLTAARARITELEQQLRRLSTPASDGPATRPATGPEAAPFQVVRVGAHESFVVVDYGAGAGASPGQILGIWRGTSPLARVQISDARPRFSLAQVLPDTRKGQLQTGDLVLLTD